jgi:sterol desaturase/sphingolipid hydroxylase (fatty acid hydroxylase superfamily)
VAATNAAGVARRGSDDDGSGRRRTRAPISIRNRFHLMTNWLFSHQTQLQTYGLVAAFAVIALWETLLPRRAFSAGQGARWFSQLSLVTLGSVLVRLALPVTAVAVAAIAQQQGWGVLNRIMLPDWVLLLLGVLAIDLGGYARHRLLHAVPLLWRFHRIHHSDHDVDCGTAIRHHPAEALFGHAVGLLVIVIVGVSPVATIIGMALGGVASVFNHGNVAMPDAVDRALRWFVVTPDMHRIHHSVDFVESNRNYANLVPWWDHAFGTYQRDPAIDHSQMPVGVSTMRDARDVTLWQLLISPFRRARRMDPSPASLGHPGAAASS